MNRYKVDLFILVILLLVSGVVSLPTLSDKSAAADDTDHANISLNIEKLTLQSNLNDSNNASSNNTLVEKNIFFLEVKYYFTVEKKDVIVQVLKYFGYAVAGLVGLILFCCCFLFCCNCFGFGRDGIRGGSGAACYQSRLGKVESGSGFSYLQSAGARGYFSIN